MKLYQLPEVARDGAEMSKFPLRLWVELLPPRTLEVLQKLERLGLLSDEVVLGLLGQAPIDPIGLYGAMKDMGVWAFSAFDFTVVQVLAKVKDTPVAAMRIDLLSDDLTFVVLREGQLVERETVRAEEISAILATPGATPTSVLSWLQKKMSEAVTEGTNNFQ